MTRGPRTFPLLVGLILIGVGGATASAAQTGTSARQAGSIWLLLCSIALVVLLARRARAGTGRPS